MITDFFSFRSIRKTVIIQVILFFFAVISACVPQVNEADKINNLTREPSSTPIPTPTVTPTPTPKVLISQKGYLIPSGAKREYVYGQYHDATHYYILARYDKMGIFSSETVETCEDLLGKEPGEFDVEFNESWTITKALLCEDGYYYLANRDHFPFWIHEKQLSASPISPEGYLLPVSLLPKELWHLPGETVPTVFDSIPADFKITTVETSDNHDIVTVIIELKNNGEKEVRVLTKDFLYVSSEFGDVEDLEVPQEVIVEPGMLTKVTFKWNLPSDKWGLSSRYLYLYVNAPLTEYGNVRHKKSSIYYNLNLMSTYK